MLDRFKPALLFALILSSSYGASFDCTKATTKVEHLICGDTQLSSLDEQLLQAYRSARASHPKPDMLKMQQRRWLNYTRDDCSTVSCLKDVYTERIERLKGYSDRLRAHSKWSGEYAMDSDSIKIEKSLHFTYSSVGGRDHICQVDGKFREVMGKLQFDDDANDCHITIQSLSPQSIQIDISACRYYCGMNAYTTSGVYTK